MKRLIAPLFILAAALAASAVPQRTIPAGERAERAYEGSEWASAAALYEIAIDHRPDSAQLYSRAIVASELAGDTAAAPDLVERAMAHGVGLSALLGAVRRESFAVGEGDTYAAFLRRLRREMPWMGRPLDNELLSYYVFRRDGAGMVKYARIMLQGLPDSADYLSILAEGYLLAGDSDEAVATWEHILSLYPEHYDTLINLGNYYIASGRRPWALEYLRRAQNIHPTPYVAGILSNN